MKITNLYYHHGNIAYVEFTDKGHCGMLSFEHFIDRYGEEALEKLSTNVA